MAYTDTANIPLHMPVPGSKEPAQIALLNENCVTLSNHDHTTGKALAVGRMRSGLAANRPAAGSAGNVYFSTDTGVFNADTGTAWVQFLTSGGQATVTGWTLVDPIVRDILSFGAKPTGTVDATITRTGAGRLRVDTNLGVGVAPAAWRTDMRAVEVGSGAGIVAQTPNSHLFLHGNLILDAGGYKAAATGGSVFVRLQGGVFDVQTAPSVAAGAAVALTSRMMVDANGNVGLGATPAAWHPARIALQLGGAAALTGNGGGLATQWSENNYLDASVVDRAILAGASTKLSMGYTTGTLAFSNAPSVAAGAAQTFTTRLTVGATGTLTLTPDAGGGIVLGTSQLVMVGAAGANGQIGSAGSVTLSANSGYWHPATDNNLHLGLSSHRLIDVWAINGAIQTSHVSMKDGFAPLDPAACADAVLGTDWCEFDYRTDGPARHQRGYVLGSDDHRTSPLFGLADRQTANASSDLAVVACALQAALRRLAALEGQSGPSGPQPAS